jgi:transcriptional regulator with XRE-family HTH domain
MPTAEQRRLAKEFGTRVRELRTRHGHSQESFAEVVGLHRTYVGGVERGERNVSLFNIVRLAGALDTDTGELMKGLRL